ncbi:MAG: DUF1571 domain-containing protein [Candidatus Schekmanbacteria bacterium]|nr:DUF1571 domain-containing protein [Candidatus Schekmanbacteria bacterium]
MSSPRPRIVAALLAATAFLFLSAAASSRDAAAPGSPDAMELLTKMTPAWEKVYDCTYTLDKKELMVDGSTVEEQLLFKFRRQPLEVYSRLVKPERSQETLFREGWNDGKMRAHPGKFPDVTVNIDPQGSLAMKNQHHSVKNAGFGTFLRLVSHAIEKGKQHTDAGAAVTYQGEGTYDGRATHKVELVPPKVPLASYTVKDGEDFWGIGDAKGLSMYLLLYWNRDYNDPDDADAGDVIKLPEYYAGKVVVDIDKETNLPIFQQIYGHDDKLYEQYGFLNLKLNVGLKETDFDPENKEYNF